jgi:tetratricopeptide (TPR) repeat protein
MATLWHEFAHVVTLQMSKYRVSRWLTEGLSVYEEKCRNPAWEDVQDEELYNALVNGTVAPVCELDGLFRSRRIGFAYLQSLHLVEFIIARYGGFDRLPAMLRSYATGKDTRGVLREVLGLSAEQFDRAFLAYLRERFAERRIQREYTREAYEDARATLELDPKDLRALRAVAWFHFQQGPAKTVDCEAALGRLLARAPNDPSGLALRGALALRKHRLAKARTYLEKARQEGGDEFYLRLHLARLSAAEGKTEDAISHLQAAKRLFPRFVGPGNPYLELAQIYRKKGDLDQARREIEAFVGLDAKAVDQRVSLAKYYLEHGDSARAVGYLREATQVSPFSIRIHHLLARSLAAQGQFEAALEEVDLAIILAEERDPGKRPKNLGLPELRLERARILRRMGRLAKAKAEAEAALRDHPDHAGLKAFLIELKETDAKGK